MAAARRSKTDFQRLADAAAARIPPFDDVRARGAASLSQRLDRLRKKSWAVGQCAVAAGVAWLVGVHVFGHPRPFFAPIAAVVSLGTTYGQRLRRVAEVTVGVAMGVFLGDLLTHVIGSGWWQITVIVVLGMTTALLLDAGNIFVNQSAVQGIVVSTLLPDPGQAFLRWSDALIGGGVAIIAASVVPRAPLRKPREQAAGVVAEIVHLLRNAADSLDDGDVDRSLAVLREARRTDSLITELREASNEGLSVLASSPFRRRHRGVVRQMADLVEPLDFALRNTRVLVRRVAVACYRREPVPQSYARFVRDLADAAEQMADQLGREEMATDVRDQLVLLARESSSLERTSELSAEAILAQLRSLIADLLAVSGMDPLAATDELPPQHR